MLFQKYIYIVVLEIASPGNQHCANCIGTLSFPIVQRMLICRTVVCVESRTSAPNITLPAGDNRYAAQPAIDRYLPPVSELQETSSTSQLMSTDGTDRRTPCRCIDAHQYKRAASIIYLRYILGRIAVRSMRWHSGVICRCVAQDCEPCKNG